MTEAYASSHLEREETIASSYLQRAECPCCQSRRSGRELQLASTPTAESLAPAQHGTFLSGYSSRRVFFTYVLCGECGARYCPTYYTGEQLRSLYSRQAENMAEVSLEARQRAQQGYADLLMKHSAGGGSFLEIGADIGLLAECCAGAGNFEKMWLFEPNLTVHGEIAARLAGRPYEIRAEWSEDIPAETVSTAAMVHVVDHLIDPAAALTRLRAVLQPNGVMLMVTHNVESLLAKLLGRRWPPYTLQHPQLYSPQSITRLVDRIGFAVLEIVGAVNYFPASHLMNGALSVLGLPNVPWAASKPNIPIRLGNMAVVVRKVGS
jgi:2-polyprenyl-3-methyl-5-hydroxy-6-metoxy-1,4-benzoquinol methylase